MPARRQVVVEIGSVVVDDAALARPDVLAAALERELARLGAVDAGARGVHEPVSELPAAVAGERTAEAVGSAVARALAPELWR